jgi:hypothetical protein
MTAEPKNLPPGQSDIRPARTPRTPKSGVSRPGNNLALKLIQVPLTQIMGLDPEIAEFFLAQDFNFETVIDFKVWSVEASIWSYQIAPMVLIERKGGFEVLGSGRALRVAQSVFGPADSVPALVLTGVKRISTEVKFQILAAELFGLSAEFRTRPNLPYKLLKLWKQMNAMGVHPIAGTDIKNFSRGTGYSLKALKPAKATESPSTESGKESENSPPGCAFESGSET